MNGQHPAVERRDAGEHATVRSHGDPYPEDWFDQFWDRFTPDEDQGISSARLIGELLAAEGIWRDGDYLVGRNGSKVWLTPDDQHLVRDIEDAVEFARSTTTTDARGES